MIRRSTDFDLGRDKTRMKEPQEAARQHATVDALLERLFSPTAERRGELQVLADEVGMGKTFVALATAYSLLAHMKEGGDEPDLRGCYQKVLIITPQNSALATKWYREVSEFVRRCVRDDRQAEAARWFAPLRADRWDELAEAVGRRGNGPSVIVASMGLFQRSKLKHYDIKRRFLLAAVFRSWGNRFRNDQRERLLKGAPEGWPGKPDELGWLDEREAARVPFYEDDVVAVLDRDPIARELSSKLLETCREIAQPYTRERKAAFDGVETLLAELYTAISVAMVRQAFPLVIVDEAHNWKNGPTAGSNGYGRFRERIGPRTRRALLLTATPFQLRPEEMLEILRISDDLALAPTLAAAKEKRERLTGLRESVIRPVLKNSESASDAFSRAWRKLPRGVTTRALATTWASPVLAGARATLAELAGRVGLVDSGELARVIDAAVAAIDPGERDFFRQALRLYVFNRDLSCELGGLVVRHRRRTSHRAFLVGGEYKDGVPAVMHRQDRHFVHGAAGMEVRGEAELPQYLLMRCISEMKRLGNKGRSLLGSSLTGCYTTLLESAEGKDAKKVLAGSPVGELYLKLLLNLVTQEHDERHPKMQQVVESVTEAWKVGQKTLIFCFRANTAERLHEILQARIERELEARRRRCLGDEKSLRALRGRLTGRDRDLIVLGLDRVLLSFYWGHPRLWDVPFTPEDLELQDEDLFGLARLALRHGIDLRGERVDRVFVTRASEHLVARRLRGTRAARLDDEWRQLLDAMADPSWVTHPYGLEAAEIGDEEEAKALFDEEGVHSVYDEVNARPSAGEVEELGGHLVERRHRASMKGQPSILDMYGRGPSLWFGVEPHGLADDPRAQMTFRPLHMFLRRLSVADDSLDLASRLSVMKALRRTLLRDSVLLRLLPERAEREEQGWGELLVEQFYRPLAGQAECMADRMVVFLEDVAAASGSINEPGTARYDFFDATQLRGQEHVALVTGETDARTRNRRFSGFNTPLLPEVLVCTSVGQEGIDLHRHCRHVVHYDLAWNPAVLEQRTGRTDRIGSMTARERKTQAGDDGPFLEIGVPFLAGTYDERMFEQLRLRAQTFEVLTGGELAAANAEGDEASEEGPANPAPADLRLVALPEAMVADLRVKLHVWEDKATAPGASAVGAAGAAGAAGVAGA